MKILLVFCGVVLACIFAVAFTVCSVVLFTGLVVRFTDIFLDWLFRDKEG